MMMFYKVFLTGTVLTKSMDSTTTQECDRFEQAVQELISPTPNEPEECVQAKTKQTTKANLETSILHVRKECADLMDVLQNHDVIKQLQWFKEKKLLLDHYFDSKNTVCLCAGKMGPKMCQEALQECESMKVSASSEFQILNEDIREVRNTIVINVADTYDRGSEFQFEQQKKFLLDNYSDLVQLICSRPETKKECESAAYLNDPWSADKAWTTMIDAIHKFNDLSELRVARQNTFASGSLETKEEKACLIPQYSEFLQTKKSELRTARQDFENADSVCKQEMRKSNNDRMCNLFLPMAINKKNEAKNLIERTEELFSKTTCDQRNPNCAGLIKRLTYRKTFLELVVKEKEDEISYFTQQCTPQRI